MTKSSSVVESNSASHRCVEVAVRRGAGVGYAKAQKYDCFGPPTKSFDDRRFSMSVKKTRYEYGYACRLVLKVIKIYYKGHIEV